MLGDGIVNEIDLRIVKARVFVDLCPFKAISDYFLAIKGRVSVWISVVLLNVCETAALS